MIGLSVVNECNNQSGGGGLSLMIDRGARNNQLGVDAGKQLIKEGMKSESRVCTLNHQQTIQKSDNNQPLSLDP
eukprot:scaffold8000_cov61-Cyclotella_meneghiniana.AAC.6